MNERDLLAIMSAILYNSVYAKEVGRDNAIKVAVQKAKDILSAIPEN